MLGHRHELAHLQSDFYYRVFHKFLRLIIAELIIIMALIMVIAYYVYFPVSPVYYATTPEGRVLFISQRV
jgi:hypothetical protein